MCQGGLFPSYRLKVTSKSEASLKSKGQGRSYLWTVWLIRDDPIGIHPAPSPTRHPCDDKPGELHMGPGLCKWPKSSLVPPNSILQALAQLDPQWYLECKSWSSNLRQVACSFGDLASSRWSLSLTKSKQFVSIKKCLSKCCSEIEMKPGELHLGPGHLKNLKLFFPSSLMGANTTTWSVRAIELWKASTLKDRNFHASQQPLHYLTWSLQTSSGAAQLPTETFINIPINFLYTVSTSNLVSSIRAQDCM